MCAVALFSGAGRGPMRVVKDEEEDEEEEEEEEEEMDEVEEGLS